MLRMVMSVSVLHSVKPAHLYFTSLRLCLRADKGEIGIGTRQGIQCYDHSQNKGLGHPLTWSRWASWWSWWCCC